MLDPTAEAHRRKIAHLIEATRRCEQGRGCLAEDGCLRPASVAVRLKRGRRQTEIGICEPHGYELKVGSVAPAPGWKIVGTRPLAPGEAIEGPAE